jgi:hypothetical protein
MAKSRTQTTPNFGEDVREKGTLIHCWWECKMLTTMENNMESPQKTETRNAI